MNSLSDHILFEKEEKNALLEMLQKLKDEYSVPYLDKRISEISNERTIEEECENLISELSKREALMIQIIEIFFSFYDKAIMIEAKLAKAAQENKMLKEQLTNYEGQITNLQDDISLSNKIGLEVQEEAIKLENVLIQTRESHNQILRRHPRGRIESQEYQELQAHEKKGQSDKLDQFKQDSFQNKMRGQDSESNNSLNHQFGKSNDQLLLSKKELEDEKEKEKNENKNENNHIEEKGKNAKINELERRAKMFEAAFLEQAKKNSDLEEKNNKKKEIIINLRKQIFELLTFSVNHNYENSENFQERMSNKLKFDENSHKLLINFVENIKDENFSINPNKTIKNKKDHKRSNTFVKGLSQNSLNYANTIALESMNRNFKNLKKFKNFKNISFPLYQKDINLNQYLAFVNLKNQVDIINIIGKETFINNNVTYMININKEKSLPPLNKRSLSSYSKYPISEKKTISHYFQINIPNKKNFNLFNSKIRQLTFNSTNLEVNIINNYINSNKNNIINENNTIDLLKAKSNEIKKIIENGKLSQELKPKLNFSRTLSIDIRKKIPEIKLEIAKDNLLDWLNENRQKNEKELAEKEFFYLTGLTLKLKSPNPNLVCDIELLDLYKFVRSQNIPFYDWSEWLEDYIKKTHFQRSNTLLESSKCNPKIKHPLK